MLAWIVRLLRRKPTVSRGEVVFVSYAEADRLIKTGDWRLALPEEDGNRVFNRVYLERIVR